MAAITKIWVDDDRLWVETNDGGDPQTYLVDPDQHYVNPLSTDDDDEVPPSAAAVWTKPEKGQTTL